MDCQLPERPTHSMSSHASTQLRSSMFVPGNRERFITKAAASSADAILLDIEDGVLPAEKPRARQMRGTVIRAVLPSGTTGRRWMQRISTG